MTLVPVCIMHVNHSFYAHKQIFICRRYVFGKDGRLCIHDREFDALSGFSCPRGSWIVCCSHWKIEFRSCARRRQWCGIFHY